MASHIGRRKFLATLGGAGAATGQGAAGVLMGPAESDPEAQSEVAAFPKHNRTSRGCVTA
jgi:hypothetical protein